MGGGLMQLVAYGAQDIYLTGNPQITFFKVVYRRHTNFSMESIEQTFNGTAKPCSRVSCTISRNGDLIHKMYLRISHNAAACSCDASGIPTSSRGQAVGSPIPVIPDTLDGGSKVDDISVCANDLINNVEIEIGGQKIDKHYGDWLNIWTQLTTPASKNAGVEEFLNLKKGKFSYIPLQFWFCRNPGLALPLIALQYHEVKLNIEFSKSKSGGSCNGGMCELTPDANDWDSATLWVDYIYLDTDERRRFAQVSHEYLIEQLQYTGAETIKGATSSVRLNFNHPIKELIWRATGMVAAAQTDKREDRTNNPVVGYVDGSVVTVTYTIINQALQSSIVAGTLITQRAADGTGDAVATLIVKTDYAGQVAATSTTSLVCVLRSGTPNSSGALVIGNATYSAANLLNTHATEGTALTNSIPSASPSSTTESPKPVYKYPQTGQTVSGMDASVGASSGDVCAAAQWSDITLQLNGHERFSERHSEYFRLIQPFQHHTSIPVDSGIHCYSFALKPEEHQPSGTCNFSRIDNAVLKLNGRTTMLSAKDEAQLNDKSEGTLRVYAVNYNVLRIMSGMGGLAYSN